MKKISIAILFLAAAAFAQKPLGGGGGGGGGAGAANPTANSVGAVTSLAVDVSALSLTSISPAMVQCWAGTGPFTPVTITNFSITGSNPITAVTPTFASTANITCRVNATGATGPAGANGAAGATGPAGPSGNFAAPYYTTTITASPMSITAVTHGQGTSAVGICYDASTNPQIQSDCQWSRDPATGNLTLTYTSAPAAIQIGSGGAAATPLTTKGDLVVYDTAVNRLGVGANNTALIADSAQTPGFKWAVLNLASALFGNQGTTTTLLHGNAAGNPAFGAVVSADLNITSTTCTNQFLTVISTTAGGTCTTDTLASAQHANQGTTTTVLHGNGAGNPAFGAVVSADLNITTSTCTNQFVRSISSGAVGSCASIALGDTPLTTRGDILFAGTGPALSRLAIGGANTLLHGSATDPAYSAVVGADFGSAITARTVLGNNTASAAAPGFNTTVDALAYQTAEIPAYVFVTASFTTSGAGTALEAITGLTWTMPGTTALNIPFHCALVYHQNTAAVAVAFGFQNATTGATNMLASGTINTSATAATYANVANTTATTATSVVSATPSAITTNWNATLDGLIEQPSGTASTFTIRVSTATQGDTVTVLRGSYCRIG